MIPLMLWLLATVDAAFIGYREAAGRNSLIDKRAYYRKALWRGAFFGQIAVLIAGVFVLSAVYTSSDPDGLIGEMYVVGNRMLIVYIPFAALIFLAFALRLLPSVDIKSITSTVVFGPLTLLRPLVAVAGVLYGLNAAPGWRILALGCFVLVLMLGLEFAIGRLRAAKLID